MLESRLSYGQPWTLACFSCPYLGAALIEVSRVVFSPTLTRDRPYNASATLTLQTNWFCGVQLEALSPNFKIVLNPISITSLGNLHCFILD